MTGASSQAHAHRVAAGGGGLNSPKSYGYGGGDAAAGAAAAGNRHSMLAIRTSISRLTGCCCDACSMLRSSTAAAGLNLRWQRSASFLWQGVPHDRALAVEPADLPIRCRKQSDESACLEVPPRGAARARAEYTAICCDVRSLRRRPTILEAFTLPRSAPMPIVCSKSSSQGPVYASHWRRPLSF